MRIYTPILVSNDSSFVSEYNSILAYPLSVVSNEDKYFFERLFQQKNPFVFCIKNTNDIAATKGFEKVKAAFFSNNYLQHESNPVIIIYTSAYEAVKSTKEELKSYCQQQGWEVLKIMLVEDNTTSNQAEVLPLITTSGTDLNDVMPALLQCVANNESYIVFEGSKVQSSIELESAFANKIKEQIDGNTCIKAFEKVWLLKNRNKELQEKLNTTTEQLTNAHIFVELAKSKYKDDYDLLFNYYRNEYEILPLWFKRLGHIVKVLQGKRTFRSLFSDNVKKYKS